MTKTRLTKIKRELLHGYMMRTYLEKRDESEKNSVLATLIEAANVVIRSKYPESDMVVLRRYRLSRLDTCIKFNTTLGQFFGANFIRTEVEGRIADVPQDRGCHGQDVFMCAPELADLAENYARLLKLHNQAESTKRAEYWSFLAVCKTLEDVEAVLALPPELRLRVGASQTALVALNEDTVASIKSDFAV